MLNCILKMYFDETLAIHPSRINSENINLKYLDKTSQLLRKLSADCLISSLIKKHITNQIWGRFTRIKDIQIIISFS